MSEAELRRAAFDRGIDRGQEPLATRDGAQELVQVRITVSDGEYVEDDPTLLESIGGNIAFGAGVVVGFLGDIAHGFLSLADFLIRDVGGSVLYGINEGIDLLWPGDLPNPYEQCWIDYSNASHTMWNLGERILTDPGGLAEDVRTAFSAAVVDSNSHATAFERGMTNPWAKVITGVGTLPFIASRVGSLTGLNRLGQAGRIGAEAEAVQRLRAAEATARIAQMTRAERAELIAEAARAGGGGGDIAFGLSRHAGTGARDMLDNFAEHVGAHRYEDFYGSGFPTAPMLENLMYGADRLHVNLDGLVSSPSELPVIVRMGSQGFETLQGTGNITNWEIWRIHQDPVLLNRTTFYLDGRPVAP